MDLLKSQTGRVLIESHCGVQRELPENSWPAIKAAKTEGADLIEVDVQLSKDGVLFVRHNYMLPDGRWGHELVWNELSQIKIAGETFPLLDEVITWPNKNKLTFLLI